VNGMTLIGCTHGEAVVALRGGRDDKVAMLICKGFSQVSLLLSRDSDVAVSRDVVSGVTAQPRRPNSKLVSNVTTLVSLGTR